MENRNNIASLMASKVSRFVNLSKGYWPIPSTLVWVIFRAQLVNDLAKARNFISGYIRD